MNRKKSCVLIARIVISGTLSLAVLKSTTPDQLIAIIERYAYQQLHIWHIRSIRQTSIPTNSASHGVVKWNRQMLDFDSM